MAWFPALTTTSILAVVLWLARNLIATRLTNAVRHEYDSKLERLKAELTAKEAQIDTLRSGVLSGVAARETAIFQKHLGAIEQLWNAVIALGPAKNVSSWMAIVKFDSAAKEAAKNPKVREFFGMLGEVDLNSLGAEEAMRSRPFVSQLAWAYFSAYQAIVFHAVARLHMLRNGIDNVEVIDNKNVTELVKAALPHQTEYIEKVGPGAFHYLLDELESNLLAAFRLMLKGDEADQYTLDRAAAIIKKAETLLNTDTMPKA